MLDLSMGEIGVIAAIALVVLGPDKLPQVAKTAGSLMGKAQRFVSQVKNDIDKEVELSELKKIQEDAKKMASDLQSSLKNTTDSIEKQVSECGTPSLPPARKSSPRWTTLPRSLRISGWNPPLRKPSFQWRTS